MVRIYFSYTLTDGFIKEKSLERVRNVFVPVCGSFFILTGENSDLSRVLRLGFFILKKFDRF